MASILVVMVVFGVVAATPAVADDVKRYSREEVKEIFCKGRYPFHVQGVATDGTNVYWSYTTVLVKTDMSGSVLAKYERENIHMGDITWHAGRVYAGINGYRPSGDEIWVFPSVAGRDTLSHMYIARSSDAELTQKVGKLCNDIWKNIN